MNREQWLENAVPRLNAILESQAEVGPVEVRVSVGWPSRGPLKANNRSVGECWHKDDINQGASQVFISPWLDDPVQVLGVLLHEMIHASLSPTEKHRGRFGKVCKAVGLEGKPTSTKVAEGEGDPLRLELDQTVEVLGEYGHRKREFEQERKKQTARLRLHECQCPKPVKVWAARDDLDVTCNVCGARFGKIEKED